MGNGNKANASCKTIRDLLKVMKIPLEVLEHPFTKEYLDIVLKKELPITYAKAQQLEAFTYKPYLFWILQQEKYDKGEIPDENYPLFKEELKAIERKKGFAMKDSLPIP